VIAEHLSVEEVAGIKEAFDMMDTGKRGSINLEELRVGLQKLGQNIADADLRILMEAVSIFAIVAENISFLRGKRIDSVIKVEYHNEIHAKFAP
jgi:Ca2+-binding EF-hand superfamily protein